MVTPAMDIYSFGMCALETAALEIQGNGDSGSHVTEEHIVRTVESLEESRQKDFIYRYSIFSGAQVSGMFSLCMGESYAFACLRLSWRRVLTAVNLCLQVH